MTISEKIQNGIDGEVSDNYNYLCEYYDFTDEDFDIENTPEFIEKYNTLIKSIESGIFAKKLYELYIKSWIVQSTPQIID